MPRSVVVGDVHGCADELDALLEAVAFESGDRLYFVGDLINRGPDPQRVVDTMHRLGGRSVRGNHEHDSKAWPDLSALPLWIDVPEHAMRIVHAGVLPRVPIEEQNPRHLLFLRALDDHGGPIERRDEGTLWGERYTGPPHVVFGHNARAEPQRHRWATGIDTACVFGGRLTALVIEANERASAGKLVSVAARRAYVPGVLHAR